MSECRSGGTGCFERGYPTVVLIAGLALSGCGSSGAASSGNPAGGATGSGDATATLKLSGTYSYQGPFTGTFVCFHRSDGYFNLAGEEPYKLELLMDAVKSGTFQILDVAKIMRGELSFPPGDPGIRITGIEKADVLDGPSFYAVNGSMTIQDDGASGHATFSCADPLQRGSLDAELDWSNCPLE